MRSNTLKAIAVSILAILWLSSCEKNAGDYSGYLDKAEAVYPGKPSMLNVYQGYNRAQINAVMSPDPRVVKMRIYWNNRRDSLETSITASDLAKQKIVNLPSIAEGVYTFEAVTFDAGGRKSVTLQKTASILGPNFTQGLFNRVLKSKIIVAQTPVIVWYAETDTSSIMAGVKVIYPLKTGGNAVVFTKRDRDTTSLTNALAGKKMIISTAYLPKNAIDTFYARPDTIAY